MNEPRRFSFDLEFGEGGDVISAPVPFVERRKRVYVADEVDTIRSAAVSEGEKAATARAAQAQAMALNAIAESARQGLSALAQIAHEHKAQSAALALAAAKVIAGGALQRFPEAPVLAALEALAREIETQPRLMVRLTTTEPEVEAAVEKAARDAGFDGQIVFRAEPGPVASAFGFAWGDGKADFDPEAAAARIAQAFEAALAGEGLHGEPVLPNPPTGA